MGKILIIDGDDNFQNRLIKILDEENYLLKSAQTGYEGLALINIFEPDLVITALSLEDMNGIDLLRYIKNQSSEIQVIITTDVYDIESTIIAIRYGAFDYIEKSHEVERLKKAVKLSIESKTPQTHSYYSLHNENNFSNYRYQIIGKNNLMKEVYKKIGKVSANKITVLIEGESGTGKELIAKNIHYLGITKDQPFIGVNCTALSETLLESELFGHIKGSFTGAIKDKKGKFELAGNGTIFLDEISEISFNLQKKLLRVLQEKEFEKVGGESSILLNSRIIAASNKDLLKLVKKGKFREDLYYRLKVFSINVPPLRERIDDIPQIVLYLLNKINKDLNKNVFKIPYESMDLLQSYKWHGNVRELENCLLQAVVLAKDEVLDKEYLLISPNENNEAIITNEPKRSLDEVQKDHITKVLKSVNWNKAEACRILKVCKATLYNKIEQYKIEAEKKN